MSSFDVGVPPSVDRGFSAMKPKHSHSSSEAESSEEESLGSFEGYKTDSILRLVPRSSPDPTFPEAEVQNRARKRRRHDIEHEGETDQGDENVAQPEAEVLSEPANASPEPSQREESPQFRSKFVPWDGVYQNLRCAVIHVRPSGIALHGTAWLSIISGRVNIHGAILTPLSPPVLFQSPFEPLLVSLTNRGRISSKRSKIQWPDVAAGIHPDGAHHMRARTNLAEVLSEFRGEDVHIFVTEVAESYSAPPLCSDLPYTFTGPKCEHIQMANIAVLNFLQVFHTAQPRPIELPACLSGLSPRAERVVVIGAGSSGKSTLARVMVNHVVTTGGTYGSFRSVVYVDVDVGQPDRGIPGVVAAHLVSEPSFARRSACRSVPFCARYFGDITPRENPSLYTRCVHAVVRTAREHAKRFSATMIVNTHGWTTGVGQGLLRDLLIRVEPTVIVRMSGGSSERTAGTAAVAMDELLHGVAGSVRVEGVEGRDVTTRVNNKLPNATLERDFTTCAYFARELATGRTVRVRTRDLLIVTEGVDLGVRGGSVPAQAMVGKVCGLGRVADGVGDDVRVEADMVEVFGYGVVRGVDDVGDWVFVATALKGEVLSQCSTMVVAPGVTTPGSMIRECAMRRVGMSKSQAMRLPFCMEGDVATGHGIRAGKPKY